MVSIVGMAGNPVLGPLELFDSTTIADMKARIQHDKPDPHRYARLLSGSETRSGNTTIGQLACADGTLELAAVFEYRLTAEERNEYVKKLREGGLDSTQIFRRFPLGARSDSVLALEAIRRDWRACEYAGADCTTDKEFLKCAIKVNRRSLQFACPELRADHELVLQAVALNGYALQFADPSLRNDPKFMTRAVKSNGWALEFADERMKANRDVVYIAVRETGTALEFAHYSLQNDKNIVLAAVRQNASAIKHASATLRNDEECQTAAVGVRWRP